MIIRTCKIEKAKRHCDYRANRREWGRETSIVCIVRSPTTGFHLLSRLFPSLFLSLSRSTPLQMVSGGVTTEVMGSGGVMAGRRPTADGSVCLNFVCVCVWERERYICVGWRLESELQVKRGLGLFSIYFIKLVYIYIYILICIIKFIDSKGNKFSWFMSFYFVE